MFLTDLTPTFLDYAGVKSAGTTYEGNPVYPIMGKSIRPILNGSAESIHGANDPTGSEMFNNTAVWEGLRGNYRRITYSWEMAVVQYRK